MTETIDVEDRELQEALQRSLEQTNLEEAMVAKALAESISTRDEEIARAMQREQLLMLERSLCHSANPNTESQPSNHSDLQAENNAPSDEEIARSLQRQEEAQLRGTNSEHPTQCEDEVALHSEGSSRENVQSSATAGPSSQAPQQQESQSPPSRKTGEVDKTLSDEELARLLQKQEEDEFKERDLQLRLQYDDAVTSRKEGGLNENVGASASGSPLTPASQAFQQEASPRRFFVHQRMDSDAKRRRRLENVVEEEACPSPETTNASETAATPSASTAPVVVVDGQNVGFSYHQGGGKNRKFCARGVEVVLDYYESRGLKAVAMVPAWRGGPRRGRRG
ncbi:Zc3h12a-like Ribonuclease NYN [Gracilaria domingensis]|nr:Zc3h12a-like Ribonuclease NYN [Gracilaria domingensis]